MNISKNNQANWAAAKLVRTEKKNIYTKITKSAKNKTYLKK